MIRGKLQTMFNNLHARRNSTDSPHTLGGNGSSKWVVEIPGSNAGGSPRTEVGEIDTSAPFESVRAAVTKFATTSPRATTTAATDNKSSSFKKTRTLDDQRVLEKETQIHLAIKQLEDLKERLKHSEATKAQAIRDLDQANKTLQDLTNKLDVVSESKQTAIQYTDAAKQRAAEVEHQKSGGIADARKQDADNNEKEAYRATTGELISAKQELTMLRRDFDVALERKLAAFQQAVDVQQTGRTNQERAAQMSKEIASLQETREQVKQATLESQQLQNQQIAEREARLVSHSMAKEEVDLKTKALREEQGVQSQKVMEEKMEETSEAVKVMEEQLSDMKESDSSALKDAMTELDAAKKKLEEITEEEKMQRKSRDELQVQVDNMKWELGEMRGKTMEAENKVGNLESQLQGYKEELEAGKVVDPGEASACDGMTRELQQIRSVTEDAKQEEEEMRKRAVQLREEAQAACVAAREAEERLRVAVEELGGAKAAAEKAGGMIRTSDPDEGKMIKLWVEEFERLSKRGEELNADADMKVATIMAQIESIEASEKEALKKQEAIRVEREAVETAIEDAVRQADMAVAANNVVEAELLRWRQRESLH